MIALYFDVSNFAHMTMDFSDSSAFIVALAGPADGNIHLLVKNTVGIVGFYVLLYIVPKGAKSDQSHESTGNFWDPDDAYACIHPVSYKLAIEGF